MDDVNISYNYYKYLVCWHVLTRTAHPLISLLWKVLIPARLGFEEEDEEVVCDKAFIDAVKLAVGPVEGEMRWESVTEDIRTGPVYLTIC